MKKEEIKIVFSDIDGTLINDKDELPHNFIEMVETLKAKDITFVAASGRSAHSIYEKLNYHNDNLYVVSDNGAVILHDGEIIKVNAFLREDFTRIIKEFQAFSNTTIACATAHKSYVQPYAEDQDLDFIREYYPSFDIVDDLSELDGEFVSISVHSHNETDQNYHSKQMNYLKENHTVVRAGEKWIDAIPPNTNKGYALESLAELLGYSADNAIAFGDFNNDIQMLSTAKIGFAMEDATEQVKAVADYVIGSNNDNSVIRKIYELLEIDK